MNNSGIYLIISKIKPYRIYIGSASNITHRWRCHLSNLNKNKHHSRKLQNHVNKYGIEDLLFSIIKLCSVSELIAWNKGKKTNQVPWNKGLTKEGQANYKKKTPCALV